MGYPYIMFTCERERKKTLMGDIKERENLLKQWSSQKGKRERRQREFSFFFFSFFFKENLRKQEREKKKSNK